MWNNNVHEQEYDPEAIAAYWSKRPGAVLQRIVQLLGVSGSFLASIAADITFNKVCAFAPRVSLLLSCVCVCVCVCVCTPAYRAYVKTQRILHSSATQLWSGKCASDHVYSITGSPGCHSSHRVCVPSTCRAYVPSRPSRTPQRPAVE